MRRLYQRISGSNIWLFLCFLFFFLFSLFSFFTNLRGFFCWRVPIMCASMRVWIMFSHGHMSFMGWSGKAVGRLFLLQNLSREALSS